MVIAMSVRPIEKSSSDPESSRDDLLPLMDAQRQAFRQQPMPGRKDRIDRLNRLSRALVAHKEKLIDAIDADFGGRSRLETEFAEILMPMQNIRYLKRHLRRWMKPERRHVGLLMAPASAKVYYHPLGVTGIVSPWNVPLFLTVQPLSYALAAGNRVMLKLSEITPHTTAATRLMLEEAFSADEVVAVTGGVETARQFVSLPFDHLLFTGSTDVGREVMRAAAENLTPVTLELGGKSPTIIGPDADLEIAAERICFGKMMNAGQLCLAPDYVYCPKDKVDRFAAAIREHYARMYPRLDGNPDHTCIINARHKDRLDALLSDATDKGARVEVVNPANEFPGDKRMPLSMIFDVSDEMKIMQQEIFGPLLPVLPYENLEQVIGDINRRPHPLALYIFERNRKTIRRVLEQTQSGGACVNDTVLHIGVHDMPFGGIGNSGMGAYHGREGFLTFSHARSVFTRPWLNSARLIYPPRRRIADWLLKLLVR